MRTSRGQRDYRPSWLEGVAEAPARDLYPIPHKESVVGWNPNLLDQFDRTAVRIGDNE